MASTHQLAADRSRHEPDLDQGVANISATSSQSIDVNGPIRQSRKVQTSKRMEVETVESRFFEGMVIVRQNRDLGNASASADSASRVEDLHQRAQR